MKYKSITQLIQTTIAKKLMRNMKRKQEISQIITNAFNWNRFGLHTRLCFEVEFPAEQ
jgi:hypothetical protein